MEAVVQLKAWRQKKLGQLLLFIAELAASYGFISWAIYNGSLLCYIAAITLFIWSIKNLIKLMGSLSHGRHAN